MGQGATQVFGIPDTGRPEFRYFGILVAFSGEFSVGWTNCTWPSLNSGGV